MDMFEGGKSLPVESLSQDRFAMNSEGHYIGWPLLGNGVFGELSLCEATIEKEAFTNFAMVREINEEELRKLSQARVMHWFVLFSPAGTRPWALMMFRPTPHCRGTFGSRTVTTRDRNGSVGV